MGIMNEFTGSVAKRVRCFGRSNDFIKTMNIKEKTSVGPFTDTLG